MALATLLMAQKVLHKCTNCSELAKAVFPQKIASVKKKS